MSGKNNYIDRTLLKLRREYSNDETVAAMDKKLKDLEYENGVLKSELSELSFLIKEKKRLEGDIRGLKNTIKDLSNLNKTNKMHGEKNKNNLFFLYFLILSLEIIIIFGEN